MAPAPNKRNHRRTGFALVLALSMMAFVLFLLASITLLIEVETRSCSLNKEQLRAREAARLALMIAVGELQKHAGPDQRVTARAEILGPGVAGGNRFWTGVWDSTQPNADPAWLVSGDSPDPFDTSVRSLELLGSETVGSDPRAHVSAPVVEVTSDNQLKSVEYAWWVADEGVKANIGLRDRTAELDEGFFDPQTKPLPITEQRQLLQQQALRHCYLGDFYGEDLALSPGPIDDITDLEVRTHLRLANESLEKVLSRNQFGLLDGVSKQEQQAAFHDTTRLSRAVLSNTDLGGLKTDLNENIADDASEGLQVTQDLRDFLWKTSPDSSGSLPLTGINPSHLSDYEDASPVNTCPVILTEFSLYCAVCGENKSSSTARAFLRFEVEVWSPYGFRHQFNGAAGSNTPELVVEFEGLPDLNLSFYDKETGRFTNSATLQFSQISPRFELDLTDTHKSGEIRKTAGLWQVNASSDKSKFYYTRDWSWFVDDPNYNPDHRGVSFPAGDSIHYTAAASQVHLNIRNSSGELLQRIENIPFGSIATDFAYYQDSPSNLSPSEAPIAFHFRMLDRVEDLETWFTEIDPRSLILDLEKPEILEHIDINDVDGDGLGDADQATLSAFSNIDFLHGQANNNFFRLYDVPATTPISIGVLQHLQFKNRPPNSIGNQWGGPLNDAFDRFFLSGISGTGDLDFLQLDDEAVAAKTLPNPCLTLLQPENGSITAAELQGEHSAQHLLQAGAFNINSTSEKAWAALLAGNYLYDWAFVENKGTSLETEAHRLNLEASVFRLPFSGQNRSKAFADWPFPFERYEAENDPTDDYPRLTDDEKDDTFKHSNTYNPNKDWRPSASIGHRELSSTDIEQLAHNIVENLQERKHPFNSIKEFVNSGILQDSIDGTSINTIVEGTSYTTATEAERLPRNATACLSQADLLSALSPALSARSDTFKIRAAGSVVDPVSQRRSTAYCEATVQRFPQLVAPNTDDIGTNATGPGRQFRILHIQWLDSSQL